MPIPKGVTYKDFDITFNKHPVTRKISTLTNNEAVKRSLKNLILTSLDRVKQLILQIIQQIDF